MHLACPNKKPNHLQQLPPTDPILGPENLLTTGFAQKGLPSIWRKNAGSHGGEAMAATWYGLYFAREAEHIEGRKSACALKLRSHMGICPHFGLQAFRKQWISWLVIIASIFWFQISLDVYYIDSSP